VHSAAVFVFVAVDSNQAHIFGQVHLKGGSRYFEGWGDSGFINFLVEAKESAS